MFPLEVICELKIPLPSTLKSPLELIPPLALITPSTCNADVGVAIPIPTCVSACVVLIVILSNCEESLSKVLILKSLLVDESNSILALSWSTSKKLMCYD